MDDGAHERCLLTYRFPRIVWRGAEYERWSAWRSRSVITVFLGRLAGRSRCAPRGCASAHGFAWRRCRWGTVLRGWLTSVDIDPEVDRAAYSRELCASAARPRGHVGKLRRTRTCGCATGESHRPQQRSTHRNDPTVTSRPNDATVTIRPKDPTDMANGKPSQSQPC